MDDNERRQRNASQMRARRSQETEEEAERRRMANRERMQARRNSRESESQEIINPRRRTAATAMLDDTDRDPEDLIDPAAYIARLTAQPRRATAQVQHRRHNETEQERLLRRDQDARQHAFARQEETETERQRRLELDAQQHALGRSQQTDEERRRRRELNALQHALTRHQQTGEERQRRLQANATQHANARNLETDERRQERQQQDADRHRVAHQTQRQAVPILPAALSNLTPAPHYCGQMVEECQSCHALFFPGEARSVLNRQSGLRTYSRCCGNGRISLPLFHDFPPTLKNLFIDTHDVSKHFKSTIRSYNSSLATASLNCKNEMMGGRGPGVFKIHGGVQHRVGPALPGANMRPSYGQLYFIDTHQALQERMGVRANENCKSGLMKELADLLAQTNHYAAGYRMMGEIYREEAARAQQNGTPIPDVKMVFINRASRDQRRFNAPTCNEVAAVFVAVDDPAPQEYTTISLNRGLQTLRVGDEKLDPMVYPLFFPTGQQGWHTQMYSRNASGQLKRITIRDYYSYYLHIRPSFSPLHWGSKLFQQFIVDVAVRVEMNDLFWLRRNQVDLIDNKAKKLFQAQIRADLYQSVQQFVASGDDGLAGTRIVLPASHQGSPRFYAQCYADTMALVTRFGKPDIFLTMTMNPDCPEVKENIGLGQIASDRPDIVTRVFNLKLKELIHDIKDKKIFGEMDAFADVIEFQKRGLPHVHLLGTLARDYKLNTADQVDQLICAELPDPDTEPELFQIVTKYMIHRKCGHLNPSSPCMKDGKCSKGYPKPFADATNISGDGYPVYRRRDDGRYFDKDGHRYTNQDVVPYNRWLLLKYRCHINLEFCFLIHAVKYLYKYIYKGTDQGELQLSAGNSATAGVQDEILQHVEGRYLCPPEGVHRLFSYGMHGRSHSIEHLEIHLPDHHRVTFQPGQEARAVQGEAARKTTLTEYFALNREWHEKELNGEPLGNVDPRDFYYSEIPEYFVWQPCKKWKVRAITTKPKIGRLLHASMKDTERHCLRRLLLARKGAISFEDLRTVNGNLLPTFEAAALDMGLIHSNQHFEETMDEAVRLQMPRELRKLFVSLLAFVQNANAQTLWNRYKDAMSEDFTHRGCSPADALALSYYDLMDQLESAGIDISSIIVFDNLPARDALRQSGQPVTDYSAIGQDLRSRLRPAQEAVVEAVVDRGEKLIFVDGPGGTGKTFIYTCIYNLLKGSGKNVACLAWTGIAANLLCEGKTICSFFKLNTSMDCKSSTLKPNSNEGRNLKAIDIFIIDEVSMLSYWVLETLDTVLQDVHNNKEPFGGKTFLLGGDFRQLLPIPPKGSGLRPQETSLKNSRLFSLFSVHKLTENMRVEGNAAEWKEFLLKVGEGRLEADVDGKIELPSEILTNGDLIEDIFEGIYDQPDHLNRRAILCPKNKAVNSINNTVLDRMQSEERKFYSVDSIDTDATDDLRYPDEFLNTLEPSGFPPHILRVKLGCIVILLRNLNVSEGLCNGTRFQVVGFTRNIIVCQFICGSKRGERVLIPRIPLLSGKTIGIPLIRKQFPLKLAFAMSITKSQGQTLERVGISLKEPVFSHGMLYVALSRCTSVEGVYVETLPTDGPMVVNVVEAAVL